MVAEGRARCAVWNRSTAAIADNPTRCTLGARVWNPQATRVATDVYGTLGTSAAAWGSDGLLTLASVGGDCSADRTQKFKSRLYFLCDVSAVEICKWCLKTRWYCLARGVVTMSSRHKGFFLTTFFPLFFSSFLLSFFQTFIRR